MSKEISIALANHKAQTATTLTDLMQIGPFADGSYRGLTLLDRPVTYDGCVDPRAPLVPIGSLTFHARTGMQPSAMQASADLGVDNSEATTLLAVGSFVMEGITQQQIDSGALDKVPFIVYRVNYRDLSQAHEIVGSGTIGEMRTRLGGAAVLEQRSLSNQLKQTICDVDSRLCRVKQFGPGCGNGGYDLEAEWVAGTVATVDDPDRVFATDLTQDDDYFSPGIVVFSSGANEGQECEIEAFVDGVVTLLYPTIYPIAESDTFDIRRDCTRSHEGHNSCRTFFDTEWVRHFDGEPHIPVGDASILLTPGADPNWSGG